MFVQVWNNFIDLLYKSADLLDLTSPLRVMILIIDIVIVSFIAFYIFKFIKQTRAEQIFKGIILILRISNNCKCI